jgi:FMN phosphatase YigB (HAD superfamily)
VWVDGVLNFLGLNEVFEDRVYTGEPDLRKPNPEIFRLIARELGTEPGRCVSIGDQNHSEIVPAKEAGMLTALIGPEQLDADMFGPDLANIITQLRQKELL